MDDAHSHQQQPAPQQPAAVHQPQPQAAQDTHQQQPPQPAAVHQPQQQAPAQTMHSGMGPAPTKTLKSSQAAIRSSPSYFGGHGGHGGHGKQATKIKAGNQTAEVLEVHTLQWFPQTKQYYYGQPTPARPVHQHYHMPAAECWLETYQSPQNIGDYVLGARWSERNNNDPGMTQVGWVWKYFKLDGYSMQMWRNKEEELLGRDLTLGYHPILFWDLRRLREIQLHNRGGRMGPILNMYFKDGGVQLRAYSYNDAEMWRSACQHIIVEVAMSDGGGEMATNRGQKLLQMMSTDKNAWSEENLSALWDAYEQNNDGVLNMGEIKSLCREMIAQQRTQAEHDIINPRRRQERVQELMQLEQSIDEDFAQNIQQKFDGDHDGRVTKTEFMNKAPKIFAGFGQSKPEGYRRD